MLAAFPTVRFPIYPSCNRLVVMVCQSLKTIGEEFVQQPVSVATKSTEEWSSHSGNKAAFS